MSMTSTERKKTIEFQDDVGEIVDRYLRQGLSLEIIAAVLLDEATSDSLAERQREVLGK